MGKHEIGISKLGVLFSSMGGSSWLYTSPWGEWISHPVCTAVGKPVLEKPFRLHIHVWASCPCLGFQTSCRWAARFLFSQKWGSYNDKTSMLDTGFRLPLLRRCIDIQERSPGCLPTLEIQILSKYKVNSTLDWISWSAICISSQRPPKYEHAGLQVSDLKTRPVTDNPSRHRRIAQNYETSMKPCLCIWNDQFCHRL